MTTPEILMPVQNALHYARITVFEKDLSAGTEIQGIVTGGSININGTSAIRRSGSLNLLVPQDSEIHRINSIDNLISANKKIKIEIGVKDLDSTNAVKYTNLGIFVISAASNVRNAQGVSISLTLKDLMCTLNGELGGMFMQSIVHTPYYDVVSQTMINVKIRDLVITLLTDYGEYTENDIAVIEIPKQIKNTVRWIGNSAVYGYDLDSGDKRRGALISNEILRNNEGVWLTHEIYEFNDNIGYVYTDFTYPVEKELTSNAGESIMSVLDKIKALLGNYEYFFDVNGKFHFQEIKDYQNSGSAADILTEAFSDAYLVDSSATKAQYTISPEAVISYSNNPKYAGIKNDIMAWGQFSDTKVEFGYHLIIDNTPIVDTWEGVYPVYYRKDEAGILRAYKEPDNSNIEQTYEELTAAALQNMDWRQQIYLDHILRRNSPTEQRTPYSREIANSWPLIYNVKERRFHTVIPVENLDQQTIDKKKLNSLPYFIDVLDPQKISNETARKALEQFTITKMGRRPWAKKDSSVNSIFNPEFPNRIYIQAGEGISTQAARNKALNDICEDIKNETDGSDSTVVTYPEMTQVAPELYKNISIGSVYNSAYDWIRSIIHEMTTYNEQISLTCMPLYELEPNIRIHVKDTESAIEGDYVIKSISIPLAHNGVMTIQASKAIERI